MLDTILLYLPTILLGLFALKAALRWRFYRGYALRMADQLSEHVAASDRATDAIASLQAQNTRQATAILEQAQSIANATYYNEMRDVIGDDMDTMLVEARMIIANAPVLSTLKIVSDLGMPALTTFDALFTYLENQQAIIAILPGISDDRPFEACVKTEKGWRTLRDGTHTLTCRDGLVSALADIDYSPRRPRAPQNPARPFGAINRRMVGEE
jgi:hypothetical protein